MSMSDDSDATPVPYVLPPFAPAYPVPPAPTGPPARREIPIPFTVSYPDPLVDTTPETAP